MTDNGGFGIYAPKILMPAEGTDLEKWATIACDQYTSDPGYWQKAEEGGLHFTMAETGWAKTNWGKLYERIINMIMQGNWSSADAENEIQQDDPGQFRREVHRAGFNIVDNKAGGNPVHGKGNAVQDHHEEGDPQAALFLVPDPVISVCRMADCMEEMLPFGPHCPPVHDGFLLFAFLRTAGRTPGDY